MDTTLFHITGHNITSMLVIDYGSFWNIYSDIDHDLVGAGFSLSLSGKKKPEPYRQTNTGIRKSK